MQLEYPEIRAILPHGSTMLLIDRVTRLEPGSCVEAIKAITGSEPCYGGVPADAALDRYAYPVSLLLESFGQAAALIWLVSAQTAGLDPDRVLILGTVRDCRFEGRALPGDVLEHRARLDQVIGDHAFVSGETWVHGSRIASIGSMLAAMRPASGLRETRQNNTKKWLRAKS